MFALTPAFALHSNYPTCPVYDYERAAQAAVHRAAHDYAVARARAEALRQREEELQYLQHVQRARREQVEARRRADIAQLVEAIYGQQRPQYQEHPFGRALFGAEEYQERLQLEAARRRAELLRQRQEAERVRAAAVARQRAEAEQRREAQRRDQEYWIALLNSQFGSRQPEVSTSRPAEHTPEPPTPKPSTSKSQAPAVQSSLKQRLDTESDPDVLEALQHLLWQLEPTHSEPVDRKGKARETPAVPFSFSQPKPEEKSVHFDIPVSTLPASTTPAARAEPKQAEAEPTPAAEDNQRALSLDAIKRIEGDLHTLRSSFVFPSDLDLTSTPPSPGYDSDSETDLAYTAKNRPVHAYEHALNGLLEKLDAVESFGDEEVRGRRKGVVGRVEEALKEVGKRVEESRERERSKSAVDVADVATETVEAVVDTPSVDVPVEEVKPQQETNDAPAESLTATEATTTKESSDVSIPVTHLPEQDAASSTSAASESTETLTKPAEAIKAVIEESPAPIATLDDYEPQPQQTEPSEEPFVVETPVSPSPEVPVNLDTPSDELTVAPSVDPEPTSVIEEAGAREETPLSPPTDEPSSTASSPSLNTDTPSFLLQPAQNPLPDATPRPAHSDQEDDELVNLGEVSEGELKEWESVDSELEEL